MTPIQHLRELAAAATPGPWFVREESHETRTPGAVVDANGMHVAESGYVPDDEFIAAANPAAILSLLDQIEEARGLCHGEPHTCDQERVAAAEGRTDRVIMERDKLRALLGEACGIAARVIADIQVLPSTDSDRITEIRRDGGLL